MFRRSLSTTCRWAQQAAVSHDVSKINIPKKVERSPTELLEALASTVGRDPTAAAFTYTDDPFLLPPNVAMRRNFALSKEQGRKVARQLANDFPTLFEWDLDDPRMDAFWPNPMPPLDAEEKTEEALRDRMERKSVRHVLAVYANIEADGVQLSDETKLNLLDFLAFYNCDEPPFAESPWRAERWFHKSLVSKELVDLGPVWKADGEAEQLFLEIEPKCARAYSAMICGMVKYRQAIPAFEFVKEMRSKNLKPTIDAYNYILESVSFVEKQGEQCWSLMQSILTWMSQDQVRPNLSTLNKSLASLSNFRTVPQCGLWAKKVFQELTSLGVQPSLHTYAELIYIFNRSSSLRSLMGEVLDKVENEQIVMRDLDDGNFFVIAMRVCREVLMDKDLAYRVHKFFCKGSNWGLLRDNQMEFFYLSAFVRLLVRFEDVEKFFKVYQTLIPHFYTPDFETIGDIMEKVATNEAYHHLGALWNDFWAMNCVSVEPQFRNSCNTLDEFLDIVLSIRFEGRPMEESEKLKEMIGAMAGNLRWRVEYQIDRASKPYSKDQFCWNANLLSKNCVLFLRAGDPELAWQLFGLFVDEKNRQTKQIAQSSSKIVEGMPQPIYFTEILKDALEANDFWKAIDVLEVAGFYAFPTVPEMVQSVIKRFGYSISKQRKDILGDFANAHSS